LPINSPKPELLGLQEPRVRALPLSRADTLVDDVLDICDLANIVCDPWQEGALEAIASVDEDGQWAATEFGILVSRQQGKGNILLPYELAHLYLWPREDGAPKLIGHTAHEGPTAREAFRRARRIILASPILRAELVGGGKQTAQGITGISTGNGNMAIELKNGNRLVFFTRTGAAGVGVSFDVLIIDEAQHSPLTILEALLPASDASPNLQVLFTGTVPKEDQDGEYFEGLRDRGRSGGLDRTGWIEHTPVGSDDPETAAKIDLGDPEVWRQGNPGLGIRLAWKTVQDAWNRMGQTSPEAFARQRLSIWPSRRAEVVEALSDLDLDMWKEKVDSTASVQGKGVILALALTAGGGATTIGKAVRQGDDRIAVEHHWSQSGTMWVAPMLKKLKAEYGRVTVVLDPKNAVAVVAALDKAKIKYIAMTVDEIAAAHALFIEWVNAGMVPHRDQAEVTKSLEFATTRNFPRGGRTWEQSDPTKPITIAQAVTWALWGVLKSEASPKKSTPAPPAPRVIQAGTPRGEANLRTIQF
jgi:phage terminase large subunit-like protein